MVGIAVVIGTKGLEYTGHHLYIYKQYMADKIYVWSGKQRDTNFGPLLKVSFSKNDIETLSNNINEKGYVNLVVSERKSPGKYGETHSLFIDTWKPEAKQEDKQRERLKFPVDNIKPEDVPF